MRVIRYQSEGYGTLLGQPKADGCASVLIDRHRLLGVDPIESAQRILRGWRVVVADDDAAMRELVTAVLEHLGCACTVCRDGAEAMDALAQHHDLMVTDIRMPHHDGYELFAAARAQRADMPILLITGFGYDPTHSLVKCADEGHQNVLYKPFTAEQLRTEICNAVLDVSEPVGPFLQLDGERPITRLLSPVEPRQVLRIRCRDDTGEFSLDHSLAASLEVDLLTSGDGINLSHESSDDLNHLQIAPELAVVIGSDARRVEPAAASTCIFGVTAAIRITASSASRMAEPVLTSLARELVTYDAAQSLDALSVVISLSDIPANTVRLDHWQDALHRAVSQISHELLLEAGSLVLLEYPEAAVTMPFEKADGSEQHLHCRISPLGTIEHPLSWHRTTPR